MDDSHKKSACYIPYWLNEIFVTYWAGGGRDSHEYDEKEIYLIY